MPEMENIEIDIEDDVFLAVAKEAHKRDITFNQMVQIILKEQIEIEEKRLHQTECYRDDCPKHDGGEEPIATCDLKCPEKKE